MPGSIERFFLMGRQCDKVGKMKKKINLFLLFLALRIVILNLPFSLVTKLDKARTKQEMFVNSLESA